jgi:hypothetical protein
MKTRKMRLIALMITLAAVVTGLNAEAQRREARTERKNQKTEKRQFTEHKNDKKEYKNSDKNKKWKSDRDDFANRNYQYWDKNDHRKKYPQKQWDKNYKYTSRYEYVHPKYGHVYRKFNSSPIRLRYGQGDIFFFGSNYYRYYRGIGYVRIAIPRNVIFYDLPFQCELVRVGPQVYYRYGDLVFERCDRGFRLAPAIDIHLSAHF